MKNQRNSKAEYVLKAVPVTFAPVPTRNGHSCDLIAETAIEIEIDGKTEQVLVSVRRGTPQFNPDTAKPYVCDVKLRCNAEGKWSGRATPCREVISMLSKREWNPDLRDALTVRLVFRKGNGGRPIAFFDGNPVFPSRGSEVVMGQPREYLLLQKDGFAFGAVLVEGAQQRTGRQGADRTSVEVRIPVAKGVAPQGEDDLDYRTERKSIGDILGIAGDGATEDTVRQAGERKLKALGLGKAKPFILQRMTECFADAIREATDKALAIIAQEKEPAGTVQQAPADAENAEASDESEGDVLDTLVE